MNDCQERPTAIQYRLKLYVTGGTCAAEHAISVLRILGQQLKGRLRSEVIDLLLHPELTLDPGLEPTPVLVREEPGPAFSYRGEINDPEEVARVLHIDY